MRAIGGCMSPPALAHIEDDPTPTLRNTVGNNSAAYTYRMANEAEPNALPSIMKVMRIISISEEK